MPLKPNRSLKLSAHTSLRKYERRPWGFQGTWSKGAEARTAPRPPDTPVRWMHCEHDSTVLRLVATAVRSSR